MNPYVPYVLLVLFGGSLLVKIAIKALLDLFSKKKVLLTGPVSSGKTTFLRYISKEKIPEGASGAPQSYKVKDASFDEVTDFSGADAWLHNQFDEYLRGHDYVLFFFDVSEYIKNERYRDDVNARVEFIYRHSESSQTTLMVGTHIDKVSNDYKAEVEKWFAGKTYQNMLNKVVYVDTTKKECVKEVHKKLKN